MKAIIDRLTEELSERYLLYIEQVTVDVWSDQGQIELRCGFALGSDHHLRTVTFKMPATDADNSADRELVVGAVFKQLELMIDEAIAAAADKN